MKPVTVACAGCGSFAGLIAWLSRTTGAVRIVSCFDPDSSRAAAFARRHRVPVVTGSYEELLESGAEAAYLPAPHVYHVSYARAALAKGLHVLVEKPLAFTLAEAEELVSLADQRGRVLAVNFHNRFHPGSNRLIARSASGRMGTPVMTTAAVPWARSEEYAPVTGWRAQVKLSGGGTLMTQAIHALDVALRAQHSPPVSVATHLANMKFAENETEDTAACQVQMADGSVLQLLSTMAAARERPATIEVFARNGHARTAIAHGAAFLTASRRSLNAFAHAIRTQTEPAHSARSCLAITAVVEAAYRAGRSGAIVHLRRDGEL